MLINLSELFTCEGKRKVYTVSFELGSIEFGGDIYKIVKAEPFELEIANIGGGKNTRCREDFPSLWKRRAPGAWNR